MVVVAGTEYGPTVTQLFEAVVHARLPEVHVRYVPESQWQSNSSKRGTPDLICHLDTSENSEWRLRLEHRGRAWTRAIEGGLSRDAAAVEAAALMAAHTSVALLTQDAATTPREPPEALEAWAPVPVEAAQRPAVARDAGTAPRTSETSASSASARDFWWLELMGAYRGQTFAAEHPWVHAAKFSLLAEWPRGPCATLAATLVEPTRVNSDFGSFTLRRQQGELLLGWCFHWDRWSVSPKGGALVEFGHRSDATPAPGVGTSADQRQIGWAGVTALELRWSLVERVRLFLGLSAAYFAEDQAFVASAVPEPVLAPYRVRFSVDVGLDVGLF